MTVQEVEIYPQLQRARLGVYIYSFWFLYYTDRTTSPLNIGEILVPLSYRQNYLAADHRRDFGSLLYRQNYFAADHRRDFGSFMIQTELPRRWSSARFWFLIIQTELPRRWTSARFRLLYYTDRTTWPLIIGEILVALLYRQNCLAAEHRRGFGCFIIQTELARRWTSARFWFLYFTDRTTSPLNTGEILVPYYTDRITSSLIIGEILIPLLYRQNYLAADHRRDVGFLL